MGNADHFMRLLFPIRQHLKSPGTGGNLAAGVDGFSGSFLSLLGQSAPFLQYNPERNPQRTGMGWSLPSLQPPYPLGTSLPSHYPGANAANLPRDSAKPRPAPSRGKRLCVSPSPSRAGKVASRGGPSPRRPGSGYSAGAPAASRKTAGKAGGRWAASGTGCRNPALQGKAGCATHRAEHVPRPRARRATGAATTRCRVGTRQPVVGALPGSPRPFRSSSHWLMCGNRRISLHFLLLPFRLPPPPAAGGGDDDTGKRGHAGRMSIAAPARPATEGNRESEPLPSPAELSGLGFPPSHHCWSPKPITHAHTRTPPASGLWATLKPRRKTDPQPLRGL